MQCPGPSKTPEIMVADVVINNGKLIIDSVHPWTKKHKRYGKTGGSVKGSCVTRAWRGACPPPAHWQQAQVSTGYKTGKGSSLSQFLVLPGRDLPLSPPRQSKSPPLVSTSSRMLSILTQILFILHIFSLKPPPTPPRPVSPQCSATFSPEVILELAAEICHPHSRVSDNSR